jgi:hypothetical protein
MYSSNKALTDPDFVDQWENFEKSIWITPFIFQSAAKLGR